ncbi:MAG: hypothetical protein ACUVWV_09610 [Thermodesulfobacteriota bacterium]
MNIWAKDLRKYGLLLFGITLLWGSFSCASLVAKQTPLPTLVITPVSGKAGAPISILGSGFIPGEKIEIIMVVDGVPVELGAEPMIKEANEMGAFKAKSNIPRNAKPGIYSIKATGDKGTISVAPLEVEKKEKK